MYASTVDAPVDRHVAALVDAINGTGKANTYSSCSGHMKNSGFPFVAFKTQSWEFVGKIRRIITELNDVTRGQTLMQIAGFDEESGISAVVRFRMYPWLWAPDINLAPLAAQLVFPPPRLVRLWWAEIAELAGMISSNRDPSEEAEHYFWGQRKSQRGFPRWGSSGLVLPKETPNRMPRAR